MSEKVIPAVDEDVGEPSMVQFDLEYRRVGLIRWRMCAVNLSVRKGEPSAREIKKEAHYQQFEMTPEGFDSSAPPPKVPKIEFRVVRKDFVVNRTVTQKFQL
jgi:hypothetical protein